MMSPVDLETLIKEAVRRPDNCYKNPEGLDVYCLRLDQTQVLNVYVKFKKTKKGQKPRGTVVEVKVSNREDSRGTLLFSSGETVQ